MTGDKKKFKKEQMIAIADSLFHYKWIAKSVGITDETLKDWRDEDEEFSHGLEEARTRFIKNNMRKAKPDFLLQTADRQIFGDKKQLDVKINTVQEILEGYGLTKDGKLIEGELDDRQDDDAVSAAPQE